MPNKNIDSTTKRLLKQFSIIPKKDNNANKRVVVPAKVDPETKDIRAVKFTTDVERLYNEWKNDLIGNGDLKNRIDRYNALDFMEKNSGIMSLAIKLYTNETISPDENGKIINVYSKNKEVEKYINDFFLKIGINRSILENTAYDIAKFADHFWILNIDSKEGITEITPISPYSVTERIEFSAVDQLRKLTKQYTYMDQQGLRMDDLVDVLTDKISNNDYASIYRKYLFGYGLEGNKLILPPWAMVHFRRFSTQSEFAPYGRPLLINSLSIFRELKSGQNLVAMARVARFPKEVFKIQVDENMTPVERMIAVNEARQEYMNYVEITNGKEEYGIGASIWTIKDLFEYELQQNNLALDDIADIEMLKDDLITSTVIPKGYLITGESAWGDSGKALLQQSKMFGREVYTNQTALLSELSNLVKTQFVLMDLFEKEDTEFELTLSFPVTEQSSENITIQKDTMELANTIMDNLKSALAVDDIPVEVAVDILKKYTPFEHKELTKWITAIKKNQQTNDSGEEPTEEAKLEETVRKIKSRLNEDIVREAYFNAKRKKALYEGVLQNQHFYFNPTNSPEDKLRFEMIRKNYNEQGKLQD